MKNLRNSVQLIGHLGKDPETRTFDSGRKVTSISLATSDTYKNQKGEKVTDTQWHNVVLWGKLAEIAAKYLRKGEEVCIEGKLVHRVYETAGGEKRYFTEISANDLLMLKKREKVS